MNRKDEDGRTALHWAAANKPNPRVKHAECVEWLIQRGAKVNTHDDGGWSPFMSACSAGHAQVHTISYLDQMALLFSRSLIFHFRHDHLHRMQARGLRVPKYGLQSPLHASANPELRVWTCPFTQIVTSIVRTGSTASYSRSSKRR